MWPVHDVAGLLTEPPPHKGERRWLLAAETFGPAAGAVSMWGWSSDRATSRTGRTKVATYGGDLRSGKAAVGRPPHVWEARQRVLSDVAGLVMCRLLTEHQTHQSNDDTGGETFGRARGRRLATSFVIGEKYAHHGPRSQLTRA